MKPIIETIVIITIAIMEIGNINKSYVYIMIKDFFVGRITRYCK